MELWSIYITHKKFISKAGYGHATVNMRVSHADVKLLYQKYMNYDNSNSYQLTVTVLFISITHEH